jgi:ABC-type thiamine transport system substrate-binding protein
VEVTVFENLTIRSKLTLALIIAALLAFATATASVALYESFTLERRAQRIMEPYVQLVSVGAEAAVAFTDAGRAQEILNTLRANSQITGAEIILEDGRLLARYSRANITLSPQGRDACAGACVRERPAGGGRRDRGIRRPGL